MVTADILTADLLEALMFFFFSIGWYWSIARMLRSGSVDGKSRTYIVFVTIGYGLGLTAQLIRHLDGDGAPLMLMVYAWNLFLVIIDLALVLVLARRQRLQARPLAASA